MLNVTLSSVLTVDPPWRMLQSDIYIQIDFIKVNSDDTHQLSQKNQNVTLFLPCNLPDRAYLLEHTVCIIPYSSKSAGAQARKSVIGAVNTHANWNFATVDIKTRQHKSAMCDIYVRPVLYAQTTLHSPMSRV